MRGRGLALLLGILLAPAAGAAEEQRPVTTERRVVVRDVRGEIEVRTGAAGELRWSSQPAGKQPAPLEYSASETEIVLRPPEGDGRPRRVLLAVPSQLAVRVEGEAALVVASALESTLAVSGRGLDVRLRGPVGAVELELAEGSVSIEDSRDRVLVRGTPGWARVLRPLAPVTLSLTSGSVQVRGGEGEIEADLTGATLVLGQIGSRVRVRAKDGRVEASELARGGEFDLTGSPLELQKASGEVRVRTDAVVEFRHGKADLHVRSNGAPVRGSDHEGRVEIEAAGAEVSLADMTGSLQVLGNGLKLRIDGFWGEAVVRTSASSIEIRRAGGPLTIENDLGDVAVEGAGDRIEVANRRGNVTLSGLSAAAQVDADAETLRVSWTSLPTDPDAGSEVSNHGGSVRVELPPGGYVELDAESFGGQIDCALPWVKVSQDARTAQGNRGRERAPRLRVAGQGDVVLAGVAPAGTPPPGEGTAEDP